MRKILFLSLLLFAFAACKKKEPVACFEASTTTIERGGTVKFDAFCSEKADRYYWYVDNVPVSSTDYQEINIERKFDVIGEYKVSLRVTNGEGKDSTSKIIKVEGPKTAPCFTVSRNKLDITETLECNPLCTKNATKYDWLIDDTFAATYNTNTKFYYNKFKSPGEHKVTLYTVGTYGDLGSFSQAITVTPEYIKPCFNITPSHPEFKWPANTTLKFDATCSTGHDADNVNWLIRKGTTSIHSEKAETTSLQFTGKGSYTVTVTLTNSQYGAVKTISKDITIY